MKTITQFQIGKFGVNEGVIESLALAFKNHKQVRISVLRASGRNRENIKEMGDEISKKLEKLTNAHFGYRVIGFTIIMIKSGKPQFSKKK
jgi:RNA-binding protein YhbY